MDRRALHSFRGPGRSLKYALLRPRRTKPYCLQLVIYIYISLIIKDDASILCDSEFRAEALVRQIFSFIYIYIYITFGSIYELSARFARASEPRDQTEKDTISNLASRGTRNYIGKNTKA